LRHSKINIFNFCKCGTWRVFDIAKSQQQKPAIQKLTKESFLKGSDEFKLEEVIAEFERKGIDEKYYKDLGEEGKVFLNYCRWYFSRP
jgi:hypothetical protein